MVQRVRRVRCRWLRCRKPLLFPALRHWTPRRSCKSISSAAPPSPNATNAAAAEKTHARHSAASNPTSIQTLETAFAQVPDSSSPRFRSASGLRFEVSTMGARGFGARRDTSSRPSASITCFRGKGGMGGLQQKVVNRAGRESSGSAPTKRAVDRGWNSNSQKLLHLAPTTDAWQSCSGRCRAPAHRGKGETFPSTRPGRR